MSSEDHTELSRNLTDEQIAASNAEQRKPNTPRLAAEECARKTPTERTDARALMCQMGIKVKEPSPESLPPLPSDFPGRHRVANPTMVGRLVSEKENS